MQVWGSLFTDFVLHVLYNTAHVARSHQSTNRMQTINSSESCWKLYLRDHQHGTWFVQSLVEVFMAHSHDTELVDLLRMTSERLSHFTNEQGEKQTCNVEMRLSQSLGNYVITSYFICRHLYKRIYFNPGLGGPPGAALVTREQSMEQWSLKLSNQEIYEILFEASWSMTNDQTSN